MKKNITSPIVLAMLFILLMMAIKQENESKELRKQVKYANEHITSLIHRCDEFETIMDSLVKEEECP